MAEEICGFLVVRKPEYAKGTYYDYNLRLEDKVYRGIDRLPWEGLELAEYGGSEKISDALLQVVNQIKQDNKYLGYTQRIARSYEAALAIQQAFSEQTEIVAVWSPEYAEDYGSFDYPGPLRYLGLDCLGLWEWSVIHIGVFQNPLIFADFVPCLNEHGLLSSEADCDRLFKRYVDVSKENEHDAEPLMDDSRPIYLKVFLAG